MPSLNERYDELRKLEERQRAEVAQREKDEQQRRQQAASSSHRFDALRETEQRQSAEEALLREADSQAQQRADAKTLADKAEIDRSRDDAAKAEQERQARDVEQLAARSLKIMGDASNPESAKADVQELHNRTQRRNEEEKLLLEKQHPGDKEKLAQFDQFAEKRLDAIYFPHDHLRDKSPEQIKELARQGYDDERRREQVKPYRNERPQGATLDTRGFDQGEPRADGRAAPAAEMTERKANKFALDDSRPKSDAQLLKDASRAHSAEKSAEHGRGNDDGRGM